MPPRCRSQGISDPHTPVAKKCRPKNSPRHHGSADLMPGRRPLASGALRVLGDHSGLRGKVFRVAYDALCEQFDLTSKLSRLEASRTAANWVHLCEATKALEQARLARETGKGARPSAQDI